MNKTQKIQEKLAKKKAELKTTEEEVETLEKELKEAINTFEWIKISDTQEICTTLQYKGQTYSETLKLVKEDEIADYNLLQKLRNEGYNSNWEKYPFLKNFYAFVPNPDEVSKKNGYVARFFAGSYCACLDCGCDSSDSSGYLGVFLIRRIK